MTADENGNLKATGTETTPLVPKDPPSPAKAPWTLSHVHRVLLCAFLASLSFGVTQVPLIWVFRIMTCDAYYETHASPKLTQVSDRCSIPEIEAGTAAAVSLLGFSTTFFGVPNLFITGWAIKKYGTKSALAFQVFWPAVRLAVQNVGVMVGSSTGIIIIQCSQIITIVGGPVGYLLALNTMIAEMTEHKERTGALGRLQGCAMFGLALGFLVGGLLSDYLGIIYPFRVALALLLLSTVYVLLFLPFIPPNEIANAVKSPVGLSRFFGPLKTLAPQRWVLPDGRIRKEYGAPLLATGVFIGVLATGFIPPMLQMYATDAFGFGATENSYLVSVHSLLRGLFLTLAFPNIISMGRRWMERKRSKPNGSDACAQEPDIPNLHSTNVTISHALETQEEAALDPPNLRVHEETFEFDLRFTQLSLFIDGIVTGGASFVQNGWQLYLVAFILPLGAGTASAAKGTILQMCSPNEKTDALSAIALVEMIARLSTTFIFGLVFAALASIERTYLVFLCNAGVALVGFAILMLSRFPPKGSERMNR